MRLHEAERVAQAAARERDQRLRTDAARRRAHGIVHTPPELARFVVRAAGELLARHCAVTGVGDRRVHVVDPACGPGAFIAATLAVCAEQPDKPARVTGIDCDAQALSLANELAPWAARSGVELSLVHADALQSPALPGTPATDDGVLLIVGNPPWAVARAQPTAAMQRLLEDFRRDEHGARLLERKLGVLADAYVRFMRMAAEASRTRAAGSVIALVTNGSFLDGPVHRAMRVALMRWFDALYVLDLGGSALLARQSAVRDDNVFGVRPSVAVSFLCKGVGQAARVGSAQVSYARLLGRQRDKLARLGDVRLSELDFASLQPVPPWSRLVPTRRRDVAYASWPALSEWMPFHREGVQTNRDALVVDRDRAQLLSRLHAIAAGRSSAELARALAPLPHFDPGSARKAVAAALERDPDGVHGIALRPIAYRPFDQRFFAPITPLCHRPRPELLRALGHVPLALVTVRKDRGGVSYAHFGAAHAVIDNCFLSTRSSCRARAFPVCAPDGQDNLAPTLRDALQQRLGHATDARAFACYALAVLASPSYRVRFEDELRMDYPRIPLPDSAARFAALADQGESLMRWFGDRADARHAADAARARATAAPSELHALRIGHHRPFVALASDPPAMAVARAQRGAALWALQSAIDELVIELLEHATRLEAAPATRPTSARPSP